MNKHSFWMLILVCFFVAFSSCSDNDEKSIAPPPVTDVVSESGYGQIFLTWKVPVSDHFYYAKVDYKDPKTGEAKAVVVSKYDADEGTGLCRAVISGFVDQDEHEFSVTSYSFSNGKSNSILVKGTAMEPAFNYVIGTVSAESDYLGALVTWKNETGVPLLAKVKYIKEGKEVEKSFDALLDGGVRIGNTKEKIQVFVHFEDISGNASDVKTFEVTPKAGEAASMDKSSWTIHSYSSSQPTEGNVNYFIDNDINTYWHTRYHNAAGDWDPAKYPHWIAVDLGAASVVTEVELYPRQNNNDGSTKIYFSVSVDGEHWQDFDEVPFDSRLWGVGQTYEIVHSFPSIRYIKVTCTEGYADYTHLAELYASGATRE